MTIRKGRAPAKINLTLHVTGQRADGYHLLDSLVVFAGVTDQITVGPAPDLRLTVSGPFSRGVPTDGDNLVMQAAKAMLGGAKPNPGAAITIEKHLPNRAGIGGGSADAACVLDLLGAHWGLDPVSSDQALALGADVPVCMAGPKPMIMRGIGEDISAAPTLPDAALVLVNPGVHVPTSGIFDRLDHKDNPAMDHLPSGLDFDGFAAWLSAQRNDLQPAASALAPDISAVLARLSAQPAVHAIGMSGSGATCWGLVRSMADARHVARAIQVSEMSWWVAPAEIL